ncbi:uncharacterized protein DS421_2g48870 [Arachis hypogaea]|nr:uncharacterized protein DS421_2g48870 [Arachis hypogaea]
MQKIISKFGRAKQNRRAMDSSWNGSKMEVLCMPRKTAAPRTTEVGGSDPPTSSVSGADEQGLHAS